MTIVPGGTGRKRSAADRPLQFCGPLRPVSQGSQRIDSGQGTENHAAATATIPTVRTAAGNIFLPTEARAAASAVAGRNLEMDAVNEHGLACPSRAWGGKEKIDQA